MKEARKEASKQGREAFILNPQANYYGSVVLGRNEK